MVANMLFTTVDDLLPCSLGWRHGLSGQRRLFEPVVLDMGRVPFDFGHAMIVEFDGALACGAIKTCRRRGELGFATATLDCGMDWAG
jgi:hypothetical protein